jgi:hypothetical protein
MLTTDTKGRKNGLLMQLPKPVIKTVEGKQVKAPVIVKTGQTRMIEGYKCEKILVTLGDSSKIESWVTNEIMLNLSELVTLMNGSFKGKSPFSTSDVSAIKGAALETTITKKDGEIMKLTVSSIKTAKPEASLFSTDGFKIADVRGLPMFGAQ